MLRFRNTRELKQYLSQIVANDHQNSGTWTTAQIFYHLAAAFEASIDTQPLPSGFPTLIRWIVRPLRWVVTRIRFPPCLPIPSAVEFKLKPPTDLDLQEQYKRLLRAIERFELHSGPFPSHPVLGSLTASEWLGFHLRHCEHHLSFICLNDLSGGS